MKLRDKAKKFIEGEKKEILTKDNLTTFRIMEDIFILRGNLRILCALNRLHKPQRQAVLLELLDLPFATLNKCIKYLIEIGFVERRTVNALEKDAVVQAYALTTLGKQLFSEESIIGKDNPPLNLSILGSENKRKARKQLEKLIPWLSQHAKYKNLFEK